jgi:acyl carrier protein
MVSFCEEMFDIEILDEDIVPENFESLRAMSRLIKRAQAR